jgi:hypothetical protein
MRNTNLQSGEERRSRPATRTQPCSRTASAFVPGMRIRRSDAVGPPPGGVSPNLVSGVVRGRSAQLAVHSHHISPVRKAGFKEETR